jgi:hypothetical protein
MNATDYKIALIVLPNSFVYAEHLDRVYRALCYRFPRLQTVDICAQDDYLIAQQKDLLNPKIIGFSDTKFWKYEIAVIILDNDKKGVGYNKIDFNLCRVYEADQFGMLRYSFQGLDAIEYPHVNSHIFNKLAAKLGNERMTYFPYGYSTQYIGLGPIDAFGHRIDGELTQYIDRDSKHILVAVFGGSAAWSTHTLYDEMFSAILEKNLNYFCLTSNLGLRVSVLNFAQPSAITLNNIIAYTLYCSELKPNIVLLHCGANDLAFGQTSDRYLLSIHKISYQFQLEKWAEILASGNSNKSIDIEWDSIPISNYPRHILKAFASRVKQFEQMVTQSGSDFIVGLQPTIYSKSNISQDEFRWKQDSEGQFWGPVLKNVRLLYSELLIKFPKIGCDNFVNIHDEFSKCDSRDSHFFDAIHTSPLGDKLIATMYAKYITNNMLNKYLDQ